jgi:ABC-type sugar transport system substrate-binding protein
MEDNMRKISLWMVVLTLCVSMVGVFAFAGCAGDIATAVEEAVQEVTEEAAQVVEEVVEEVAEEAEPEFSFEGMETGYVIPYLEGWFFFWEQGWKIMMEEYGVATSGTFTYWEAEKDLAGVRDMITKGVDAIVLTSTNPDPAQMACKEANDAGIPIAVDSSSVAEGPGEPFLDITFDYYEMGKLAGEKIAELGLGTKVVYLSGIPGFAPSFEIEDALRDIAAETGAYEVVAVEYCNYSIEESITLMKAIIQSGQEFDVVVGCSQEPAEGTIEALRQEGMLGEKVIISVNGGPLDVANFEAGNLDYAVGQSPGLLGLVTGAIVLNHLQGIDPFSNVVRPPFQWLSADNYLEEMVPWDVDASWIPAAEKYAVSGELVLP